MERLDVYDDLPTGMRDYLSFYGWHFSEKLAKYAVSKMKNQSNKHFDCKEVGDILTKYGVDTSKAKGHDACYLYNMYYSDFFPKALDTEAKIAEAVKCILSDEDGYDGMALTRYYADCIGKGEPLMWEKFI